MERLDWRTFEVRVRDFFGEKLDIELSETKLQVGQNQYHKFDLVSPDENILIECKSFTWTAGGNSPQAKFSTANETILFLSRVEADRKMLVMQDDFSPDGRSLVRTYANRYGGLADDIEIWQYIPQEDSPDKVTKVFGNEQRHLPDAHKGEDHPNNHPKAGEHLSDKTDWESPEMELDIDGIDCEFERLIIESFDRDSDGEVKVKKPQARYSKSEQRNLHTHGEGPFCQFEVDFRAYEGSEGVFLIIVDDTVKYIGRSSDIGKYIYDISNVSPSACYEGGQMTVCRINTKIHQAVRENMDVTVWATVSNYSDQIKQELLERYHPSWNFL